MDSLTTFDYKIAIFPGNTERLLSLYIKTVSITLCTLGIVSKLVSKAQFDERSIIIYKTINVKLLHRM